jgi:hypothetical protein
MTGKILVIYFHSFGHPLRKTNEQMLYCFDKFSSHLVYFLNLAFRPPKYIFDIQFDLVIFHDLLLCKRSLPRRFETIRKYAQPLKRLTGLRIATVQDEFTQTDLLNDFLCELDIRHIFSVAPPSEWPKIYPKIDRSRVKFDFCLTGYLDATEIETINQLSNQKLSRTIDLGYRATPIRHALGSVGYLKVRITEVFKEAGSKFRLKTDLSNNPKDTFYGDAWYKFLLSCKYVLGVESGASVLDRDGSIESRVQRYLKDNATASFEEVRSECLADVDGNLHLCVMGPRHLEACLTRTCQILTEGEYNGILKPFIHYIPVKKDFSDIQTVLEMVVKDDLRLELVENAYRDIVQSGKYSLEAYVQHVLTSSLGESYKWLSISTRDRELERQNVTREARIWRYIKMRTAVINTILRLMPAAAFKQLERFMKNQ